MRERRLRYAVLQKFIPRTVIEFLICLSRWDFDVDKVNFELPLGLDTDKERRTTSGSDDFVGEVGGLEDESK